MMNLKLKFPDWILNASVKVYLETEGEAGPVTSLLYDGLCSYAPKSIQMLQPDKEGVFIAGTLIFKGDLNPDQKIDGYVEFDGQRRQIKQANKFRNPDGSIFSTELTI